MTMAPNCDGTAAIHLYDRKTLLRALLVGDIFHADCPSGASLICLTTGVSDSLIEARTVTTQVCLQFDRGTRVELGSDGAMATIDSVAPLPVEIHNVMLGIDRKFRLTHVAEHIKLNEAEKKALIFVASHYPANLLPEE